MWWQDHIVLTWVEDQDEMFFFVVVSSSKLFDVCKCEHMQFAEKPQRPPFMSQAVFPDDGVRTKDFNDGNAICLYYIYIYIHIYIGISLRISCDSKPTFSWNQKNGSLIPSILFRGEKIGGLLSLTSSSYLTRWPQELRLMVKGLVGGFRFLVNSVTHGEST